MLRLCRPPSSAPAEASTHVREPPEGPSKGSRTGTWASRLGVPLVWEPNACGPQCWTKDGTGMVSAHCPQPPGAGGRPGACACMCARVGVQAQRGMHMSVCVPECARTCLCPCGHVCVHTCRACTTKHAHAHELHCVHMQACAHTRVHMYVCTCRPNVWLWRGVACAHVPGM